MMLCMAITNTTLDIMSRDIMTLYSECCVMLSVVMPSVVMPSVPAPKLGTLVETIWLLHFKSKPQFFSFHFQNGFKKKFFFRQKKNIENWIDPSTTDSCGLYNKYFTAVINTKDLPNCAACQFHPSLTFASKAETNTSRAPYKTTL